MKLWAVSRSSSVPIPAKMRSKWAKENADIILSLWNFSYLEEKQIATTKAVENAEICLWNRQNKRSSRPPFFLFGSHIDLFDPYLHSNATAHEQKKAGGSHIQSKFAESMDTKELNPNGAPNRLIKFCHCTYVNICQAEYGRNILLRLWMACLRISPLTVESLKRNNIMNI